MEGDFLYAPPGAYDPIVTNLGEERLQVIARQPIYDGGARRAELAQTDADIAAAGARYRIAERDLAMEVSNRFGEMLAAEREIDVRQEGTERLAGYRTSLESRKAAGQGVSADLLKTDVRIASEEASIADAESRRDEARIELNELMGRPPASPLRLAPLPPPSPPAPAGAAPSLAAEPWARAPEIEAADAAARSAAAELSILKAERRPHLDLTADAGIWGSDTSHLIPPDLRDANPHAAWRTGSAATTGTRSRSCSPGPSGTSA